MKRVEIYTDGACSGNPGVGGWGSILIYKGVEKIISGGEALTTNNRMELTAIIKALEALKEPCEVRVYSDSQYAVDAIMKGWLTYWMSHGWRTKSKDDVKNVDLWEKLVDLMSKHQVTFIKVKGHSDNENNNRCDEIARDEIAKIQKSSI
ncbi:MAG: ribonuclease HI [Clostridia bacterium]|nr:ribonuclease HI [Clostridia bacterium]